MCQAEVRKVYDLASLHLMSSRPGFLSFWRHRQKRQGILSVVRSVSAHDSYLGESKVNVKCKRAQLPSYHTLQQISVISIPQRDSLYSFEWPKAPDTKSMLLCVKSSWHKSFTLHWINEAAISRDLACKINTEKQQICLISTIGTLEVQLSQQNKSNSALLTRRLFTLQSYPHTPHPHSCLLSFHQTPNFSTVLCPHRWTQIIPFLLQAPKSHLYWPFW